MDEAQQAGGGPEAPNSEERRWSGGVKAQPCRSSPASRGVEDPNLPNPILPLTASEVTSAHGWG